MCTTLRLHNTENLSAGSGGTLLHCCHRHFLYFDKHSPNLQNQDHRNYPRQSKWQARRHWLRIPSICRHFPVRRCNICRYTTSIKHRYCRYRGSHHVSHKEIPCTPNAAQWYFGMCPMFWALPNSEDEPNAAMRENI